MTIIVTLSLSKGDAIENIKPFSHGSTGSP